MTDMSQYVIVRVNKPGRKFGSPRHFGVVSDRDVLTWTTNLTYATRFGTAEDALLRCPSNYLKGSWQHPEYDYSVTSLASLAAEKLLKSAKDMGPLRSLVEVE